MYIQSKKMRNKANFRQEYRTQNTGDSRKKFKTKPNHRPEVGNSKKRSPKC